MALADARPVGAEACELVGGTHQGLEAVDTGDRDEAPGGARPRALGPLELRGREGGVEGATTMIQ